MKDTTKLTGLFRPRVSFAASSSIQGVAELAHGVSASLRANAVATLNTAGPVASSILLLQQLKECSHTPRQIKQGGDCLILNDLSPLMEKTSLVTFLTRVNNYQLSVVPLFLYLAL